MMIMPTMNNSSKTGQLCIYAYKGLKTNPISGAKVSIYDAAHRLIDTLPTNISGQTEKISLIAPDKRLSLETSDIRPYSVYSVIIEAQGYISVEIQGVQIFDSVKSVQEVQMDPQITRFPAIKQIKISKHRLYGVYQPTMWENPLKIPRLIPQTIIPEFIQVHAGKPNQPAPNYKVPFKDYIKKVACCEIYSTWHKEAIKANILCIISFTLNRVQTEHYRKFGFTITSSTQYDHKYDPHQTIHQPISQIVDEMFDSFIKLSVGTLSLAFLAHYSKGTKGSPIPKFPDRLSQYGSEYLAKKGYNYLKILKYYYGKVLKKIIISKADKIAGIPETYPGHVLKKGSTGKNVKLIQNQLNKIAKNYPAISKLEENGVFDLQTETAVKIFQKIAKLTPDGIVGRATWYRISDLYVAIRNLETLKPQYNVPPYIY
jgi:hypothetical protein